MNRKLLEYDICSLLEAGVLTMSRAKEILQLKYINDMRDIYNEYKKKKED